MTYLYVYKKTVPLAYVLRMSLSMGTDQEAGKEKKVAFIQRLSTEALCYHVQDVKGKSSEECEV